MEHSFENKYYDVELSDPYNEFFEGSLKIGTSSDCGCSDEYKEIPVQDIRLVSRGFDGEIIPQDICDCPFGYERKIIGIILCSFHVMKQQEAEIKKLRKDKDDLVRNSKDVNHMKQLENEIITLKRTLQTVNNISAIK